MGYVDHTDHFHFDGCFYGDLLHGQFQHQDQVLCLGSLQHGFHLNNYRPLATISALTLSATVFCPPLDLTASSTHFNFKLGLGHYFKLRLEHFFTKAHFNVPSWSTSSTLATIMLFLLFVKPLATVQPESCSLGAVNWCWSGISSQIPWAQYSCCDSWLSFDPSVVSTLCYSPAASLAQTPLRLCCAGTDSWDL